MTAKQEPTPPQRPGRAATAKRGLAALPPWLLPVVLLAAVGVVIWLVVFRENKVDRDRRLMTEARQAMQTHDFVTAEKRLRDVLHDTPQSGIVYHNLGILYVQQGQAAEARRAFERAVELALPNANEVRAEDLFQLAQISYGEKKWSEAAQDLQRAIAAHPTRVQLHTRLLDLQLGRLQDVIGSDSTTSRFLRVCGRTPQNLHDISFIYYKHRSYERSETLARQAVALSDTVFGAHSLVARSLWKTNHTEEGLKYLDGVLQRYPRTTELWVARGGLLQSLGRSREALEAAEKAVAIDPKDYPSHQLRALALASEGRNADALKELAVCRTLVNDPAELQRLASVETNLKRANEQLLSKPLPDSTGATP
jgi:tetratricopeptide (TPR) repeat protein